MEAIIFRLMYENCISGVILSGTINDEFGSNMLDFKYISGENRVRDEFKRLQGKKRLLERARELDFFFLGAYTIPTIKELIDDVKGREIETVILPYVPPIQRLSLLSRYEKSDVVLGEEADFLADPDKYLCKYGVKNRFFLYNNGTHLPNDFMQMEEFLSKLPQGDYLDKCESDEMEIVRHLEGHEVDLRKAGYIYRYGWFFYFGVYGLDFKEAMEMELPKETIVLFTSPIRCQSRDYGTKMFAVALNEKGCCNQSLNQEISGCVRCMHEHDYVAFNSTIKETIPHDLTGHFLLGNYNMNQNMGKMLGRFSGVRERIRVVSVPNCGETTHWNRIFPSLFAGDYTKYWYLNVTSYTDSSLMLDIVNTSPRNRFLMGNSQISYCLSGIVNRKANKVL